MSFDSSVKSVVNATLASAVILLALSSARAEPLHAGAARIDITPPLGHPMWGYGARHDEPSVGVRDPLYARAVVLKAGKNTLAIVSLDLGRAPTRQGMLNIRKQLKVLTGIETIFLVASHTHHGPVLELDNWPAKEKPYVRDLEEKIVQAITNANKNLKPASLGISSHDVTFNRNRHSKRPDPPVDREMLIVRIDDAQGKPIAHLVNFAAHPTMLPAKLCEFSADYPGFLAAQVEKELGGQCLFLQGAAGDLSPNPPGERTPEKFGEAVGAFVVDRSRKIQCDHAELKKFKTQERDFRFAARTDIGNPFVFAAYSYAFFPGLVEFYKQEYREGVRPHLSLAVLDDQIGIVGVSGEFFSSHAVQLKRRARLDHLLFLGYCNDYHQYFPTIEAVAEGGYGADATVAMAEIGAGERIMDQALIDLLRLQGKLPTQGEPSQDKPAVLIPDTLTPEVRKYLESLPDPNSLPAWPAAHDLAGWKRMWDADEAASEPKVQATLKRFEPTVKAIQVGGVPVLDIRPKGWKDNGKVLVHAHGGCYTFYSARSRLPSSVPAAAATGLRVVSVDYTVAPLGKWEKVTDQMLAVLDGLQKEGYKLKDIALYGESAGGGLVAGSVLKMRDQGLGMPAAIVLWSPWADLTNRGDSAITLKNFEPLYRYDKQLKPAADAYADPKDQKHPYVSPVYGDYSKGFPPTLIQGGTREVFLSHFVRQYRAIDDAGGTAVLDLYDGMPHVFQIRPELVDAPETRAAMKKMAGFLKRHLGETR